MCGRTRCALDPKELSTECSKAYRLDVAEEEANENAYAQKENVSPGSKLPILRLPNGSDNAASASAGEAPASATQPLAVVMQGVHWGLVPSFTPAGSKPDFFRMFNARCESVASKGVFSRLLKHKRHRCLVVVDGFYEWKAEHKVKQPYYLHMKDRPLVLAGLCDTWAKGEGADEDLPSCTILTTGVSEQLAWLHTRQPVMLPDAAACRQWLETDDIEKLQPLYTPYNGPDLVWHAVTPHMNKASYQAEDCAKPLKQNKVSSFFSKTQKGAAAADPEPAGATAPLGKKRAREQSDDKGTHDNNSGTQGDLDDTELAKAPKCDAQRAAGSDTAAHGAQGDDQSTPTKAAPGRGGKQAGAPAKAAGKSPSSAGTKSLHAFYKQ